MEEFLVYFDILNHLMYYMTKVEKKVEIRYKEKLFYDDYSNCEQECESYKIILRFRQK